MRIKSILKISFVNLRRRKLRSFLTILGVAIAIGMLFFLINTAESVKKQINDFVLSFSDATRIQAMQKYSVELFPLSTTKTATTSAAQKPKKITDKTIKEFERIAHVRAVYPDLQYPSSVKFLLSNPKEATSSAVYVSYSLMENKRDLQMEYGSEDFVEKGEFFKSNSEDTVIIQQKLTKILKLGVGDLVNLKMESVSDMGNEGEGKVLGQFTAKVVGVVKDPPPQLGMPESKPGVIISYSIMKKVADKSPPDPNIPEEDRLKKGEYYSATVFVDNIKNVREVEKKIKDAGFEAISVFSELDMLNKFILIIQAILAAFSLIGIIVALVGISNTMFMSVLERTKEVGILKALGARNRDIYRMFITESATFGFLGAILGIVVTSIFGFIIAFIGNMYVQSKMQQFTASGAPQQVLDKVAVKYTIDSKIFLATIAFATLIAILAGFLPARRASKLDPVQSLKYE